MYDYFKGKVTHTDVGWVTLEQQQVGYRIEVPTLTTSHFVEGREVTIFVYHHVSETEMSLYGFINRFDRSAFELLISVSGVGPKMAVRILSHKNAQALMEAVAVGDAKTVQAVKGLGEKTSKKLVLEIQKKAEALLKTVENEDRKDLGASIAEYEEKNIPSDYKKLQLKERMKEQLVATLLHLGYRESEVVPRIEECLEKTNEDIGEFEEVLKTILQKLSLL